MYPCIEFNAWIQACPYDTYPEIEDDKIKTRVTFEQQSFMYQDWPSKETWIDLETDNEGDRQESVLGNNLAENDLELPVVAESQFVENLVFDKEDNYEKEEQMMTTPQQPDVEGNVLLEPQVADKQGQANIEPSTMHQETLEAINILQLDNQENREEIGSSERINPDVDAVEVSRPPVLPQGHKKRDKLYRAFRRLCL